MKKRGVFRKMFVFNNKKGQGLIYSPVIFLILNIMFASMLLLYVFNSSSGALIYEQAYSKQIALLVDQSEPGMLIKMDFSKAFEIAEDNKYAGNFVEVNENKVIVRLANGGGYAFSYFSDYDINSYFDEKFLIIVVNEKGEGNVA